MEFEQPDVLISDVPPASTGAEKQQDRSPIISSSGPGTLNLLTKWETWIERLTLPRLLILLAVVSLVLRIFYAGYLFEDDGLWFTAAEQILRGKALYREIYFDKPPALPLVYALLFKLFGAHILVIRLFTVVFATIVSGILYLFASRLYDRKTGVLAAVLFTFFSTTGVSGHVQGLNTDFLMVLPYTLGAYLLAQSRRGRSGNPQSIRTPALLALAGGGLTGVAVQTNPKGIFNLAFFAALLMMEYLVDRSRMKRGEATNRLDPLTAVILLGLAAGGVLAGSLPFVAYLAANHSLSDYLVYVWGWGFRYARYYPLAQSVVTGVRVVLSYLALNSILTIALCFLLARLAKKIVHQKDWRKTASGAKGDLTALVWLASSFAAMTVGGRFYTHYVFEILPGLCLVGARGLICIKQWAGTGAVSGRDRFARRILVSVLAAGLLVTVIRFHTRTAVLAIDWVRGSKSESTGRWFHEILNREERMAAGLVDELPGGPEEAMGMPPEAIRAFRHSAGQLPGPSEYLFVWGYRPEVYYWSGLIPASRFISIQPVTGIPADIQYNNGKARSILSDSVKQIASDRLLRDLEETKPKYIVDEAGMFNSGLLITSYPGMEDFMRDYKQVQATGRLMVYRRRDPSKKKRGTNVQ